MMNRKKKQSPRMKPVNLLLFGLAAILLLMGTAGTSRAALTYFSENYVAEIDMKDIGITLTENGDDVSRRDYTQKNDEWDEEISNRAKNQKLLTELLKDGETFQLGKEYDESISVRNSGNIDEYVRLTIYRYWLDKDGEKTAKMDPKLIDLNFDQVAEKNGWIIDPKSKYGSEYGERIVMYYSNVLKVGDSAPPVSDKLSIDSKAGGRVTRTEEKIDGKTIIKVTYEYDGAQFVLEAEADAVQTHNAVDAIKSAWGVDVNIAGEDGPLSLK